MRYLRSALICLFAIVAWTLLACYGALYGWWMTSIVEEDDHAGFSDWAVQELETQNRGNTAFMLIEGADVVAEYYGQAENRVDRDTLFPTASFSKWITAVCVMFLVESGKLELDEPVETYLSRWHLPESEFDNSAVTIRRLLSHTAGLTDKLGFGDYTADEEIPALEDELRSPRASNGAEVDILVGREPGRQFLYSGGGYLILELIVEEVTGQEFAGFVQDAILTPLGMSRSTFEFIGDLENVSQSFQIDGSPAPTFQYASAAATGFASSAAGLFRLVTALIADKGSLISPSSVASMRQPQAFVMGAGIWGLGTILYSPTPGGDFVYGHDGANDPAINVSVRINPDTADAMILLVNGHPTLASTIGSEWVLWQTGYPDFLSTTRALKSAVLPSVLGSLLILLLWVIWIRGRR